MEQNAHQKTGALAEFKDAAAFKWTAATLEDSDGFEPKCECKKLSDDLFASEVCRFFGWQRTAGGCSYRPD
jgi:hypothetical protein